MRIPTVRTARLATIAATPIAVILAGAMVWQSSYSAFTGSTRTSGNEWSTGSVALSDDDQGSARFQVANMKPGDSDTKCIKVTTNASVPGVVKGSALNSIKSVKGLEDRIVVTVREGTGGSFADCAGFRALSTTIPGIPLSTLAKSDSYANGVGAWEVASGTSTRTYEVSWKFDVTGMTQEQVDALQGQKTGIDFQWELQSS